MVLIQKSTDQNAFPASYGVFRVCSEQIIVDCQAKLTHFYIEN